MIIITMLCPSVFFFQDANKNKNTDNRPSDTSGQSQYEKKFHDVYTCVVRFLHPLFFQ